ncbi:MAG: alpha/beta hydrolase [Bacteroidales bacterium]|nr:alpha/beta hydrolase [Bacteroidales bacterium]
MVKIGGVRQAVLINGDRTDNPVLVFLHGGPGFPMLPFEPFSESMRRLESQYTVVYWEQRGTGKSFSRRLDRKSMNMEQFISDTREVIDYVREFLNVDKVYLWGHSWGSNVGAIYASRYPETLHAYISTGQSVDPFQNERLAYEFVRDKAIQDNNPRALRQLARIDTIPENYTLQNALTIRKWVYRYGGIVYQTRDARPYVDLREIITMLTTPVYSLGVRINLLLNPYFSAEELWEDLMETNLLEQAPEIEVPVYFLVGRHDIIVSHYLAEKYFMELSAPRGKKLIWFEESAHRPFSEEKDKFLQIMKTTIPEYQIRGFSIDQIPVLP